MPKVSNIPEVLRPFAWHGVDLREAGSNQAIGTCIFCEREDKFYVNMGTSQWDCKVCGAKGNSITFLRQFWELCDKATNEYAELEQWRGIADPNTLVQWQAAKSITSGEWLIPGYNPEGQLSQLYRYMLNPMNGKRKLLPTPTLSHGLSGLSPNLFKSDKTDVYLCEGVWNGMLLWETLKCTRLDDRGNFVLTAALSQSLLDQSNVVTFPGCGSMGEPFRKYMSLFAGKRVFIMGDSDHPKVNSQTRQTIEPAGYSATKRAAAMLGHHEEPPEEIFYLKWGDKGYNLELKDGYDVSDALRSAPDLKDRPVVLQDLLGKVVPIPGDWVQGRSRATAASGGTAMDIKPCENYYGELIPAWRKPMKWTEGLDRALSVMLAAVVSTKAVGDQLWVKVMGPASCGKSTLCEALSVNRKYVAAKSTIRGFHSGFKSDKEGKEDNSLINQIRDKTLITKDGDTLLQSPNLGQILAEARDLYDKTSRTHYRNRMSRSYEGVNLTWILCGTSSLRQLDSSELGQRFLDCVITEGIDEDLEDEILARVASRTQRSVALESDGKMESQHDPDMVTAMQLTGGYVSYLRVNARDLLSNIVVPEWATDRCIKLGKFVAYTRARPSKKQVETVEREFAARLVSQLVRLACCMAVVLNKKEIDKEVMRRVTAVAMDTSRGIVLDLLKEVFKAGDQGVETKPVSMYVGQTEDSTRDLLRFLKRIGATETFVNKITPGLMGRPRWRLTQRMRELWKGVMPSEQV